MTESLLSLCDDTTPLPPPHDLHTDRIHIAEGPQVMAGGYTAHVVKMLLEEGLIRCQFYLTVPGLASKEWSVTV